MEREVTRRVFLGVGLAAAAGSVLAACAKRLPATPTVLAPTRSATATVAMTAGATSVVTAVPTAGLPACVVRPAQTEGPYFVDEKLNRSDIRNDLSNNIAKPGTPLALTFRVLKMEGSGCSALAGAMVDVWHCDAAGAYSDARDQSFNTVGQKFLRGYQLTDGSGSTKFTTIYPGWYQGRAVHIHFKIRSSSGGKAYDFTSQLYFEDAFSDEVFKQAPYAARGTGGTRNGNDGNYRNGGAQLTLNPTKTSEGYAATFDIGLQMS